MPLSLDQIKQNCQAARQAFARARRDHYALGAFNLDNQETLIAVARAAAKHKAPVLVEVSHSEVALLGLANLRDLVDNYKNEYGIEMYINLDHSPTVELAQAAIQAGFECIHIDISQAKHDATEAEIIGQTRKVVESARHTGAMVEAEPHYFAGSSNLHNEKIDYQEIRQYFTVPVEAKRFVEATGIDTYAVAIGNLHGAYPVPKRLDLDLLRQIRREVDCYLSLHGGSGTPPHYFMEAVKLGISKININSDMRVAYRQTLERVLADNPDEYAVVKLMDQVIDAVQKVVEKKLEHFNSSDRAKV